MISNINFVGFEDINFNDFSIAELLEFSIGIKIKRIQNIHSTLDFVQGKRNILLIDAIYPEDSTQHLHSFDEEYESNHFFFPFSHSIIKKINLLTSQDWRIIINLSQESFKIKTKILKEFLVKLKSLNTDFSKIYFLNNDYNSKFTSVENFNNTQIQFLNFPSFLIKDFIGANNLNVDFDFIRSIPKEQKIIFPNNRLKHHKILNLLEFVKAGYVNKHNFSAIVGSFNPANIQEEMKEHLKTFLILSNNENFDGQKSSWKPVRFDFDEDTDMLDICLNRTFLVSSNNSHIMENKALSHHITDINKFNYIIKSNLCIFSETYYKDKKGMCPITEKTFIPMRLGISSASLGCRNMYSQLKEIGFLTYENYLGFSFDQESDLTRRKSFTKYVSLLLSKIEDDEVKDIDRYNFNLFKNTSLLKSYLEKTFLSVLTN